VQSILDCSTLYLTKEEESMNNWIPLKRAPVLRNTMLDEILQFALFAHQTVPWLLSGPSDRSLHGRTVQALAARFIREHDGIGRIAASL
jgi:hypothetical protein